MRKQIVNYVDDFLEGSYTIYNYNSITTKNYLIYCQIAGFQKIGKSYYNELSNFPLYMINFTTKGKGTFIIDNKEYELEEGD